MAAVIIRAEYDELDRICTRFADQAELVQQQQQWIERQVAVLEGGGWQGRGIDAFSNEMRGDILPAMERLHLALAEAQQVALAISTTIRAAEEEAAALFDNDMAVITLPGSLPSESPLSPIGDHVQRSPMEVFSPENMQSLIDSHFRGENSTELNQLMEDMHRVDPNNGDEVERILNHMADIRGVDRDTFYQQYETYRALLENAETIGGHGPDINLNRHDNYLGTTVSLRYGSVVGNVFGIDPVFGSLLNPTGGLVGPGSSSYAPSVNDSFGYHGVVHDAAGYLYNFHNIGPGYDYLNQGVAPTGDELAGHTRGISWWATRRGVNTDLGEVSSGIGQMLGLIALDRTEYDEQLVQSINDAVRDADGVADSVMDFFDI